MTAEAVRRGLVKEVRGLEQTPISSQKPGVFSDGRAGRGCQGVQMSWGHRKLLKVTQGDLS